MDYQEYISLSLNALEKKLSTSFKTGLSLDYIKNASSRFGLNQISISSLTNLDIFKRQLNSPFIVLLGGAALLSYFLHDAYDSIVILVIIIVNVFLGFIQEHRAQKILEDLNSYTTITAHVIRDAQELKIDSKNLIPGDIVFLEPGDAVPADIQIIESESLLIDESALSGESLPVFKDAHLPESSIAYWGTIITGGSAKGIVLTIGNSTRFGRISSLTLITPQESNFQKTILKLSHFLIKLTLSMLAAVFILNLIIKGSAVSLPELIMFCVALALSITPEALPVITTIALSQGAARLAKRKVIAKRLSAIEDLGSITVLCTDKTGTLTEDELSLIDLYTPSYSLPEKSLLEFAALSISDNNKDNYADSFDQAIIKNMLNKPIGNASILAHSSFDPKHKRKSTLVQTNKNQFLLIVRANLEELLPLFVFDSGEKTLSDALIKWTSSHAQQGQRVLSFGYKILEKIPANIREEENNLIFAGLMAFEDPIKKSVPLALKKAHDMGIIVKILTGDVAEVAEAVARKIGLITNSSQLITGEELKALDAYAWQQEVNSRSVFASVSPEQKYEIVNFLKQSQVVGFLGDGINDAPALKAAHVGIVVNNAVPIAQNAADILLLKKSLSVVIDGIGYGREIFANITKYIRITLASNLGNFYSLVFVSFFIDFLPMLPIQVLLLNILSDAPMIAISTDNVDIEHLKRPSQYEIKDLTLSSIVFGSVSSLFDFLIFGLLYKTTPAILQTTWFVASLFTEIALIFILRTNKRLYQKPFPSKTLIVAALIVLAIGSIIPFTHLGDRIFLFVRLPYWYLSGIILLTLIYVLISELVKAWYKNLNHSNNIPNGQHIKIKAP